MDTPSIRQIKQSSFRNQNRARRNVSEATIEDVPVVPDSTVDDSGNISGNSGISNAANSSPLIHKYPGLGSISGTNSTLTSRSVSSSASIPTFRSVSSSIDSSDYHHQRHSHLHPHHLSHSNSHHSTSQNPIIPFDLKNGVVDLSKTSKYCVSLLPSSPAVLNESINLDSEEGYNYQGLSDQTTNFSLVSNEEKCLVWNYTSGEIEPTTIDIPYSSPNTLSILVAPAPGTQEPGLVTIVTNTGMLTYYESISSAITNDLLKKKKSITHEIKLYSYETIDNIKSIEPVGIVVSTIHGRFILITLRDLYGKQLITSVRMKQGGPGIMSSIKNAIVPSSSRRGIVSIKPGSITGRIDRQVSFINNQGDLSIWECSRNGQSRVLFERRFYELMLSTISSISSSYHDAYRTFKVHDIEVHSESNTIFILSSFEVDEQETFYFVFSFSVVGDNDVQTKSVFRLQTFTGKSSKEPKMIFPKPFNTLFIVFSEAVVMLDSNISEETPTPSTTTTTPITPSKYSGNITRWEDIISFKTGVEIIGSNEEDLVIENGKTIRNCGIIALIRNVGVIRIEVFKRNQIIKEINLEAETIKSRIEQAIFFGSDEQNPLQFNNKTTIIYDLKILESSFLKISKEILQTKSIYMSLIRPSLAEQLSLRVHYLTRLAQFLHDNFVRKLSIPGKFQLLWDLEKATAAESLWTYIDSQLLQSDHSSILLQIITEQQTKKTTTTITTNRDLIRDWFIYNSEDIGSVLIESLKLCNVNSTREVIIEGNNAVILAIDDAAMNVRNQFEGQIYYLFPNDFCNIEPWTSNRVLLSCIENQYKLTAKKIAGSNGDVELESQLVKLTETLCAIYTERIEWCNYTNQQTDIGKKYEEQRNSWIRLLVKLDYAEDGLRIAEKFQIYRSLVEICVDGWNICNKANDEVGGLRFYNKIKSFFESFGYEFANILYQYFIETKQLKSLLVEFPDYHVYLDRFFSSGRYGRISWIRNINQGDYDTASKVLSDVELNSEDSNINRRLELSIAKLTTIAGNINKQDDDANDRLTVIESRIQAINIQESVYQQIEGYINEQTNQRYQLFSNDLLNSISSLPVHQEIANQGLAKIRQNRKLSGEELLDVLTLIDETSKDSKLNFIRSFNLLQLNGITPNRDFNEKLIWLRLLLKDDWKAIVNTKKKSDAKVKEISERTIIYHTVKELFDNNNLSKLSIEIINNPNILLQIDQDNLHQRYNLDPSKMNEFIKEYQLQISNLKELIKDYGLPHWTKGIYFTIQSERMDIDR